MIVAFGLVLPIASFVLSEEKLVEDVALLEISTLNHMLNMFSFLVGLTLSSVATLTLMRSFPSVTKYGGWLLFSGCG